MFRVIVKVVGWQDLRHTISGRTVPLDMYVIKSVFVPANVVLIVVPKSFLETPVLWDDLQETFTRFLTDGQESFPVDLETMDTYGGHNKHAFMSPERHTLLVVKAVKESDAPDEWWVQNKLAAAVTEVLNRPAAV